MMVLYLWRHRQHRAERQGDVPRHATTDTADVLLSCCPFHARHWRVTLSSDSPSGQADTQVARCASCVDMTTNQFTATTQKSKAADIIIIIIVIFYFRHRHIKLKQNKIKKQENQNKHIHTLIDTKNTCKTYLHSQHVSLSERKYEQWTIVLLHKIFHKLYICIKCKHSTTCNSVKTCYTSF